MFTDIYVHLPLKYYPLKANQVGKFTSCWVWPYWRSMDGDGGERGGGTWLIYTCMYNVYNHIKVLKTQNIACTSEICMFWGNFILKIHVSISCVNHCFLLNVIHLFCLVYIYANTILAHFLSAEGFKQFSVLAKELSNSLNDMVGW